MILDGQFFSCLGNLKRAWVQARLSGQSLEVMAMELGMIKGKDF